MSIWIAMLLGLVQGLCEFLPVSSSGHLVLLQKLFGIEGALFFDTMLHLGTLAAVVTVYYKQIWAMIRRPIQRKVGMLLIATAVTAVIYLAFNKFFEGSFEDGKLLGVCFLLTAGLLFACDHFAKGKKAIDNMRPLDAVGVGLLQGVAILPGLSRSGATIAGSRFFGLSKEDAAEFSFILSIPAILGGLVVQIPDVLKAGIGDVPWAAIIAGTIVAAVSGYFAVRVMIRLIVKKKLWGFGVYVGALGILVLLDQFVFHVFF